MGEIKSIKGFSHMVQSQGLMSTRLLQPKQTVNIRVNTRFFAVLTQNGMDIFNVTEDADAERDLEVHH